MSSQDSSPPGSADAATLIAAARTLYPHSGLPDEVYARVGVRLAEAARDDSDIARTLDEGISALNAGPPFPGLAPHAQLEALRSLEGTDFFELVRSNAVVQIYSDERTWELCGYEGPSFDQGGYLHRGFNDLDWLPQPDGAS